MMKFTSLLHKPENYPSVVWLDSQSHKHVKYAIRRVSLAQRIELMERIRELSIKHEFLKAGSDSEKTQLHLADLLVQRLYIEWAVADVTGLIIDGEKASINDLITKGPASLCSEIVGAVRAQIELCEEERKN